jgi:hypothetical protein
VGGTHIGPELLGNEAGLVVLKDDRAPLHRNEDVVGEVDCRPKGHHADPSRVPDVDDIREQERAYISGSHLPLDFMQAILPEFGKVNPFFLEGVALAEDAFVAFDGHVCIPYLT